jgi:ActR/RegA family two-component response regulator
MSSFLAVKFSCMWGNIKSVLINRYYKQFAADQQLNQVLSTQAKQSLQQADTFEHRQQLLKQKVWGFIEQALKQQNEVIQDYVARQMHYSERTLQRQLKSYQA